MPPELPEVDPARGEQALLARGLVPVTIEWDFFPKVEPGILAALPPEQQGVDTQGRAWIPRWVYEVLCVLICYGGSRWERWTLAAIPYGLENPAWASMIPALRALQPEKPEAFNVAVLDLLALCDPGKSPEG